MLVTTRCGAGHWHHTCETVASLTSPISLAHQDPPRSGLSSRLSEILFALHSQALDSGSDLCRRRGDLGGRRAGTRNIAIGLGGRFRAGLLLFLLVFGRGSGWTRQDFYSGLGDPAAGYSCRRGAKSLGDSQKCLLKLSRVPSVQCNSCPVIFPVIEIGRSEVDHRLLTRSVPLHPHSDTQITYYREAVTNFHAPRSLRSSVMHDVWQAMELVQVNSAHSPRIKQRSSLRARELRVPYNA